MYISDFYIGDLRSGQFCHLPTIRQWVKNEIPPLRIISGNFIMKWVILGYCSWFRSKFWSVTFIKVIWFRMTSSEVTNRFLLTIHDWKELDVGVVSLWSSCHDTSPDMEHDLLGSKCDPTWPWPEVRFWPDLSRSPGTCFDAPWRKEYHGARIKQLASLVRMLFAKTILPKRAFWRFFFYP